MFEVNDKWKPYKYRDLWEKIVFQREFWAILSQPENRNHGRIESLRVDLEILKESYLIPNSIKHWQRHYDIAQSILFFAKRSLDPRSQTDYSLDKLCNLKLSGFEWDIVCTFLGYQRKVEKIIAVRVPFVDEDNEGAIAKLTLELVEHGNGRLFHSPAVNTFLTFDSHGDFKKAITNVETYWQKEGKWPTNQDIRWKLERDDGKPLLNVSDNSIGGAFHFAFTELLRNNSANFILDDDVAISISVNEKGELGAVGHIEKKLEAILKSASGDKKCRMFVIFEKQVIPSKYFDYFQVDISKEFVGLKIKSLEDGIEKIKEFQKPRQAVLKEVERQCATLKILDRYVSIDPEQKYYQALPLLQEIEREWLFREQPGQNQRENKKNFYLDDCLQQREDELYYRKSVSYESMEIADIFTKYQRFVVLGLPGTGKSAWTQYVAWRFARRELTIGDRKRIPVILPLCQWEICVKKNIEMASLSKYLENAFPKILNAPNEVFWLRTLEKGDGIFIFDGLDEISIEFQDVVKNTLLNFPLCPAILSCRSVSYEQRKSLGEKLPIFTLAHFDKTRRDMFIRNFPAARPQYNPEVVIEQIESSQSMRELASNPLLLSIICYVLEDAPQLYPIRNELYHKALFKMLKPKEGGKYPFEPPEGKYSSEPLGDKYPSEPPDEAGKIRILEHIAFALEKQDEKRFSSDMLDKTFLKALQAEWYDKNLSPWCNAFKREFQKIGILRGDAEKGYFFLHYTFQEYLAAAFLARTINNNGWEKEMPWGNKQIPPDFLIDRKAWDPTWRELIVMLTSQLDDPRALLNLLHNPDPTDLNLYGDDVFRHRLVLAIHCLTEISYEKRSQYTEIIDNITTDAFVFFWKHSENETLKSTPFSCKELSILIQLNGMISCCKLPLLQQDIPDKMGILDWLQEALHDNETRTKAKAILIEIGPFLPDDGDFDTFLDYLFLLCHGDSYMRWKEISTLMELESFWANQSAFILFFLTALEEDEDPTVRRYAVEALGKSGALIMQTEIAQSLFKVWQQDKEFYVRREAANALTKFKAFLANQEDIIEVLLKTLEGKEPIMRTEAAKILGEIGSVLAKRPDVIKALLKTLKDEDMCVRWPTAEALGKLGTDLANQPEVIKSLLEALEDKEDFVRGKTALALAKIFGKDLINHRKICQALINIKTDYDDHLFHMVQMAYEYVEAAYYSNSANISSLISYLQDEDYDLHLKAAAIFVKMGADLASYPEVIPHLVEAVMHDVVWDVSWGYSEALKNMGSAVANGRDVIIPLLECVQRGFKYKRPLAAEVLGVIMQTGIRIFIKDGITEVKSIAVLAEI